METTPATLPNDLTLCHQLISDLLLDKQKSQTMIEKLQHQLEQLLRYRYGQRADRIDPNQLKLFVEQQLAQAASTPEAPETEAPVEKKVVLTRRGHGRKPLPASLPRVRQEHDIPAAERVCPKCGANDCRCIGEETSERLEYQPASLYVIQDVRFKYACVNPNCDGTVLTAAKPGQPIEKGLPGPGLLAHVAVSKYGDHLPLNRQEGIFARHGLVIPRQTQCDWMMAAAELLRPLVRLMKQRVLASRVIHTDDTPVPVLDPQSTKTKEGRLWVYIGDARNPYIVYDYTPNRRRDGPVNFLAGYKGYLQADAWRGYDRMYAPAGIIEVACWAHARRKYVEAQSVDAARALTAVAWVKSLYKVEHEARERDLAAVELCALRQKKSKPLLDDFEVWLKEEAEKVLPKSPIGKALAYTLSNWEALNRYLEDGELDPDNSEAERAMRYIAVGRNNWLFAGSDRGGRAAAILYSPIRTCKALGLDPYAYLRDILARIADHPITRLSELLPDRWAAARLLAAPAEAQAAAAVDADAVASAPSAGTIQITIP